MTGQITYLDWITRDMVRAEPEARFVFGDNIARAGFGGQAAAMRDEPNSIGVATKRFPGADEGDFFSDLDADAWAVIEDDIDQVAAALAEGRAVYVPRDGLGTGLSELPTRAPGLHRYIIERFRVLDPACPWVP